MEISEYRRYYLHKNYKQHHRYRIHSSIGNSRNVAVSHGISRGQSRCTRHTSCNRSHKIQHVNLENQQSDKCRNKHRDYCYHCSCTEQSPPAVTERFYKIASRRSADLGKEQKQSQLTKQLVGRSRHGPKYRASLAYCTQNQCNNKYSSCQTRRKRERVGERNIHLSEQHPKDYTQSYREEICI